MNEIILPERAVTFGPDVKPAPQLSYTNDNGGIWGRLEFCGVGYIGGLPTFFAQTYSSHNYRYSFQFDGSKVWACRYANNAPQYSNTIGVGTNVIFNTNNVDTKGIAWTVTYLFNNWVDDFPILGLKAGVTFAAGALPYFMYDRICFPQGSISCSTTNGSLFVGHTYSGSGALSYVATCGAGCPTSSNWGLGRYSVGGPPDTYTISDGSGSSGDQPFLRQNGIKDLLTADGACKNVELGHGLVACLADTGQYSNLGTKLRVYRYGLPGGPPNSEQPCAGTIEARLILIYERDLKDICGPGNYTNCCGMWSDGNGLLALTYSRQAYRRMVFFKFPGPVIQVVSGLNQADAPNVIYIPMLMQDGRIVFLCPSTGGGNTRLAISTTSINMNITINYNPPVTSNAVYSANLTEVIGG